MWRTIQGAAKTRIIHAMLAVIVFVWTLSFTGCSLIGLGLGAAADDRNPGKEIAIPAGLAGLRAGTELEIITRDNITTMGRYLSKGLIPDKLYPVKFEKWRANSMDSSRWVPSLGTPIYVGARTESRQLLLSGAFAGFDSGTVRIESPPGSDAIGIKIETVDDLRDSSGKSIADKERLIRAMAAGMPFASCAGIPSIMIAGAPRSSIALEDIEKIYIPTSGGAKWTGLIIGLAVDVVVVMVAATVSANLPHF